MGNQRKMLDFSGLCYPVVSSDQIQVSGKFFRTVVVVVGFEVGGGASTGDIIFGSAPLSASFVAANSKKRTDKKKSPLTQ